MSENELGIAVNPAQVMDNVVLLSLNLSKLGNKKQISAGAVQCDAEKKMITVSKKLLESDELENIGTMDGKLRQYVYSRALPANNLFRGGVYILPLGLVREVENELQELRVKRNQLVEMFIQAYEDDVDQARSSLGSLFNPTDYKEPAQIRAAFGMEWQYVDVSVSSNISKLDKALFEQQREQQAEKWRDALDEVKVTLRTAVADFVAHVIDKLTPDEEGKVKRFKVSAFEKMRDFFDVFEVRNIACDDELAAIVAQARALTDGIGDDNAVLRTDAELRNKVFEGFKGIQTTVDGMLIDAPKRRQMNFDD